VYILLGYYLTDNLLLFILPPLGCFGFLDSAPPVSQTPTRLGVHGAQSMAATNFASQSREVRVCLISDNRLLRDSLARLLRKQLGILVISVLRCSEVTRELLASSGCDILITDCPPVSPHSRLFQNLPNGEDMCNVLMIGMENDPQLFLKAVYMGVQGYLLKDASAGEIVAAVRGVARGEATCPATLCMKLIEHVSSEAQRNAAFATSVDRNRNRLTHRQVQLMSLVAKGLTNKEIAASLNLSQFTVKNHIRRVMRQVEASSRHDAVEVIRTSGQFRTS
jgi:two-component system, NarL family, response regulator